MKTTAEILKEAIKLFKQADNERLDSLNASQAEAEKWKAEGDWFGWNFWQGHASGQNEASIIFYRLKRFLDEELKKIEHAATPPK